MKSSAIIALLPESEHKYVAQILIALFSFAQKWAYNDEYYLAWVQKVRIL